MRCAYKVGPDGRGANLRRDEEKEGKQRKASKVLWSYAYLADRVLRRLEVHLTPETKKKLRVLTVRPTLSPAPSPRPTMEVPCFLCALAPLREHVLAPQGISSPLRATIIPLRRAYPTCLE